MAVFITAQINAMLLLLSFGPAHQGPVVLTFEEDDLEATELMVSQVDRFHKSAGNTVVKPPDLFTLMWYFLNIMLVYILLKRNDQFYFLLQCHLTVALQQDKPIAF